MSEPVTAIDANQEDRFVLRQRFRLMVNQYEFTLPGPGGKEDPSRPVAFVEQKRMKLKEDIRFYTDETKTTELLRIKARQRFDPKAKYDVTDAAGNPIGQFQKVFGKSLMRSTYRLFGPNGEELAIARERSMAAAIGRRLIGLLGLIPILGDILELMPIPYHFDFVRGETVLGTNRRQLWRLRDTYTIDFTGDPGRTVDRRLALALAVGQDALQAR